MRVELVRGFLTQSECDALNDWVSSPSGRAAFENGVTVDGEITTRHTTRFSGARFVYPQIVLDCADKVRKYCGISGYPIITGHGRDGIVVSHTFPGGDVYAHRDPPSASGVATLRCNIMTRGVDAGGVLHIEGQPIEVQVGDLCCYLVSEHEHYVTKIEGTSSRVMWMFGAHVPAEDWNSGKIQLGKS